MPDTLRFGDATNLEPIHEIESPECVICVRLNRPQLQGPDQSAPRAPVLSNASGTPKIRTLRAPPAASALPANKSRFPWSPSLSANWATEMRLTRVSSGLSQRGSAPENQSICFRCRAKTRQKCRIENAQAA
jgi:hypothetical protein